jgi:small subunit ribosomal protein S9
MNDEPNETPDQPEAEEPQAEEPAAEEPQAEEPQAEEPQAEEPQAEDPQAEEPAAEEPQAEEPAAEPDAGEPEAKAAPEPPAPEKPGAEEEKPKAKDTVPGAELEPIALEPERELSAEERARLEAEEEERARREAEEVERDEPLTRTGPQVELAQDARYQATGKRKSSIARVIVSPGGGGFVVNDRNLDEYFPRSYLQSMVRQPLVTAGYEGTVDVRVRVHGGGIAGQAGAVRHGIARALTEIDPQLRSELKRRGLLTRDARKKERRKAGLKKARKRPQFSKR